ncbi:MAG: glycosyltransferase [Deltaproteobacteria bacterium]|nr:MAG: glycosyltransferase [Deltaproteobacteria bacterium]
MLTLLLYLVGGILTISLGAATFYYLFFSIVAYLLPNRRIIPGELNPSTKFAIIIPAHDEEETISPVLASLTELDYPEALYSLYVIADNCSDDTARLARLGGAEVLERTDDEHRGKGYALSWAIPRVLNADVDAVLVLDADCTPSVGALRVADAAFHGGCHVLQLDNRAANPDDSPASFAVAVGNAIENDLFYAPKARLGLNAFLRGTGMVIHRDVLERHPWNAHSVAEDVEYSVGLISGGEAIRFTNEASVSSPFPVDLDQLRTQRERWAGGNIGLGKRMAFKLVFEGLKKRRPELLDAGATMLLLSRPLALLLALASIVTGWMAALSGGNWFLFDAACIFTLLLLFYLSLGLITVGLSPRRFHLLLGTPAVVLSLVGVAIKGLVKGAPEHWEKTPRR